MQRTVSRARRIHILDGDANGGGHRAGTGRTGKTEFPAHWDDDRIIREIESIANDPALSPHLQANGRNRFTGTRDGVEIEVIVDRDDTSIVTGYPTNTPANP
ncbi:EndoU domain-containing protein [Methylobacterium sp. A54F]